MATAVSSIETGTTPILQTKTVTPTTSSQNVVPDSGYDGLSKVTVNAMPTATQATPSISVNSSGLITASATQAAGYVASGTKSATKQLTTQAAKTITPSTSSQTAIAKNVYTTGAITVAAIPSNYEDVGTETSDYTTKLASLETAVTALETELAGKASGGGASMETCTVTVGVTSGSSVYCTYTKYENGITTYEAIVPSLTFDSIDGIITDMFTLTNVVCNSTVFVQQRDSGSSAVTNNVELLQSWQIGRYFVFKPFGDGYIAMYD